MGMPIVIVASGGRPVVLATNGYGMPCEIASNGFGIPVTIASNGYGLAVTGFSIGPDTTAPIITSSNAISVPENQVLTHYLMSNEAVTWAKVGGADQALFTLASGVLTLPPQDFEAGTTKVVQVQATDLASNVSTVQTITVTITDVDEVAPTITSADAFSTPENAAYNHTLTANETVTWAIVGGADAAQFSLSGNTLTLASQDYEAGTSKIVQVRATDTAGNQSAIQTITATITNVDETAPVITSAATFSTPENAAYNHTLTADESVTWAITGGADAGQFSLVGSTLTLAAQDYEAGTSRSVQVRATNAVGLQSYQTITATITDVAEGGGGTAGQPIGLLLALTKAT
jgi:hypothetical protein